MDTNRSVILKVHGRSCTSSQRTQEVIDPKESGLMMYDDVLILLIETLSFLRFLLHKIIRLGLGFNARDSPETWFSRI